LGVSWGLLTGDDLVGRGGGLLLGGTPTAALLEGLASNCGAATGLRGVLPMSAYFQKGAGELVGMCWLGRGAVLGGARRGCTRGGAGVTNADGFSSWRKDEASVGESGCCWLELAADAAVGTDLCGRGKGLPSDAMAAAATEASSRVLLPRSGVDCVAAMVEFRGDDGHGEVLRFRADVGSLAAMSRGPWVI
jgi:hypothetical protein